MPPPCPCSFRCGSRRRPATVSFFRIRFSVFHCATQRYLIIINYVAMGQPQPGALSVKGLNFLTIYKKGKMEIHKKWKGKTQTSWAIIHVCNLFNQPLSRYVTGFHFFYCAGHRSMDRRIDGSTARLLDSKEKCFFLDNWLSLIVCHDRGETGMLEGYLGRHDSLRVSKYLQEGLPSVAAASSPCASCEKVQRGQLQLCKCFDFSIFSWMGSLTTATATATAITTTF